MGNNNREDRKAKWAEEEMTIYLVRHGESTWNTVSKFTRFWANRNENFRRRQFDIHGDAELSELGLTQVKSLKDFVEGNTDLFSDTKMWVSPLRRAIQTSMPVQAALKIDTVNVVGLAREVKKRIDEVDCTM